MDTKAVNSSPDIFVYLGHGNEQSIPYEERPKVPSGSTVVLATKSGNPLDSITASEILAILKSKSDLFKDPLQNKVQIENEVNSQLSEKTFALRIYPEGSPMPVMNFWPEGSMIKSAIPYKMLFYMSGIYKVPYISGSFKINEYTNNYIPVKDIESLYPGDENVDIRLQLQSMSEGSFIPLAKIQSIKYTTPELVMDKGSGIHLFLNCRYVADLRKKSNAFIAPLLSEYSIFLRKSKAEAQLRLKEIEELLKKSNKNINIKGLQNEKQQLKNVIFDLDMEREVTMIPYLYNIKNNASIKPEDKLIYFRHALAQNSYLNANQQHEPLTNEEFNLQIRPKTNRNSRRSTFKRNAVRKFNETFGNLRTQLRLTRQKSQEFQRSLLNKTRRRK